MSEQDLVKAMIAGFDFLLYTQNEKVEYTIYYFPATQSSLNEEQPPIGILAFGKRGMPKPVSAQAADKFFDLDTLTDVYIGRQTPSYIAHPLASQSIEDNCISLVSEALSLDLEASSESVLNAFLDGLNYILTADGKLVFTSEEESLIEQLELGTPLTLHSQNTAPVTVYMVYSKEVEADNDDNDDGSFYYTAIAPSAAPQSEQDRQILKDFCLKSITRCRINLSTLTEVVANNDNPSFGINNKLNPSCCFTIHTTQNHLSFQARDEQARNTWIDGITVLVKRCSGVTVECIDDDTGNITKSPETTETKLPDALPSPPKHPNESKDGRRYTVMRSEPLPTPPTAPSSNEPTSNMASEISSMMQITSEDGIQFIRYPGKKHVYLTYNPRAETLHLRSYPRSKDGIDRSAETMPIIELGDVFIGNQRPAFAELSPDHQTCLSLVTSSGIEWSLDAVSVEEFSAFLNALNEILAGTSQIVAAEDGNSKEAPQEVDESDAATTDKKTKRRYSVMPNAATTPQTPTALQRPAVAPSATLSADSAVFVKMLAEGRTFMGYAERNGQVIKNQVRLFYMSPEELHAAAALEPTSSPEASRLVAAVGRVPPKTKGRLYWCAPNKRVPSLDSYIEVSEITDVYLGKQTKLLCTSEAARNAPRDCCFSILSRHDQLDLEADSPTVIQAWIQGLQAVLTSSGRKVMMEANNPVGEEEDQRLVRKKNSKRFSIAATMLPPPKPTPPPPRPTATQQLMDYKPVEFMLQGAFFERYYTFSGQPKKQEIFLILDKPDSTDSDRGGRLRWYDAEIYRSSGEKRASGNAQLRISSISDVYVGKSTQSLKSLVPPEVSSKTCFTVVGKERDRQVVLSVRADKEELVDEWLKGIQYVIVHSGRAVVEEKPETSSTNAPTAPVPPEAPNKSGRRFTVKGNAPEMPPTVPQATPPPPPGINPKTGRRFTVKSSDASDASTAAAAHSSNSKAKPPPIDRTITSAPTLIWDSFLLNADVTSFTQGKHIVIYEQTTEGGPVTKTDKIIYFGNKGGKTGSVFFAKSSPSAPEIVPVPPYTLDSITEEVKIAAIGQKDVVGASSCIPVDTLTDIVIGKADPIWKSREFLTNPVPIRSDRCFSLCTKHSKVHCVADDKNSVNIIVSALQHVLAHGGKKVYYEETQSNNKDLKSRKMSLVASANTPAVSLNSPFASVSKGSHITLYNIDNQGIVRPTTAFMFYSNEANGGLGALLYTETNATGKLIDSTSKTLSVASIQVLLRGKQTVALRSSRASRCADSKCMSIIACSPAATTEARLKYVCLDIELESTQHAQGWYDGLTRVIASTPPSAIETTGALTKSSLRFTRYLSKIPHAKATHQRDSVILMPLASSTVATSNVYLQAPAVDRLTYGLTCISIREQDTVLDSKSSTKNIIVKFDAGLGQLGAISWVSADDASSERRLLLTSITMANYGCDQGTPDSITVVGNRGQPIIFTFASPTECILFIQAIDQILLLGQNSLKSAENDETSTRTRLAAAISLAKNDPKKSTSVGKTATAMGFDYDTMIDLLERGSQFYLYDLISPSSPPLQCTVKYQLYSQNHRGGAIACYNAQGQVIETVYADEITDIIHGKSHVAFSSLRDSTNKISFDSSKFVDATCMSILSKNAELHLATYSLEDSIVWRLGISAILTSLGGTLVLEDTPNDAVSPPKRRYTVLPSATPNADRPHDPTDIVLATAGQDIQTVIEGNSAGNMMKEGREFNLCTRIQDKIIQSRTLVKYQSTNNSQGELIYITLDTNQQKKISLDLLTDVFLGKQTDILLDPSLADVEHDLCFSLHFSNKTILSFISSSAFLASGWLLALSNILSGEGMNVILNDGADETTSNSNMITSGPGKRRYSVMPTSPQTTSQATVRTTIPPFLRNISNTHVQTMLNGSMFYMYLPVANLPHFSGVPVRMFLWLDYSVEEGGYVIAYSTATSTNPTYISTPDTRFPFALLTDIYVGSEGFTSQPVGNGSHRINPDNCLIFKGDGKMLLCLEAPNDTVHTSWIEAVQYLLEHGTEVAAADEQNALTQPEVVDPQDVKDEEIFSKYSPSQLLKLYLDNKPEVSSLSLPHTVAKMTQGQIFRLYPSEHEQDSEPVDITFIYEPETTSSGSTSKGTLHWKPVTPSGNSPAFATGRTKLSRLSDIFLGISQPAFKLAREKVKKQGGVPDNEISRDCCVALVFKSTVLHLRAPQRSILSRWMWGINELLRSTGPITLPTKSNTAKSGITDNDSNPALTQTMIKGTHLVTYRTVKFGNDNVVEKSIQLVYYDPSLHALVHVSPSAPKIPAQDHSNVLLLDCITDVYVGKDTPELQSHVAESAPDDSCVSLIADMNATLKGLHIQASSADELQTWIQAFSHLLTLSGADVIMMDGK